MNKKGNNILICLFITFTIISLLFSNINIYIEKNHILETSLCYIIYPFTFLFIILFNKKNKFKDTHNLIINTSFIYLIFISIITLLNNITSTNDTFTFSIMLKQLFTPNVISINKHIFYYPNLLHFIISPLLFYFSHTSIVILYEAMKQYTNRIIAFFLALFIPFTLEILCYTTLMDLYKKIDFNNIILHLTSNFVIVIVFSIILSIIYGTKKVD